MLSGQFVCAEMHMDADTGAVELVATVRLVDDVLGPVGLRQHVVQDPAIVAQVVTFTDAMLPTLSTALGIAINRPAQV
jgi:hypothetical protein